MDEIYVTYVDDEHVDNHDYDDTTDDDHDNNNGLAWSGPVRPGSGPAWVRSGPSQKGASILHRKQGFSRFFQKIGIKPILVLIKNILEDTVKISPKNHPDL